MSKRHEEALRLLRLQRNGYDKRNEKRRRRKSGTPSNGKRTTKK